MTGVNWTSVIVGAILAFALGALWYSKTMFAAKWIEGQGTPSAPKRGMAHPMIAQAVGTFLFAWLLVLCAAHSMALAVLAAFTSAVLIKANGLFGGKSTYAIAVESSFVLAMAVVILAVDYLLK